jgi:hypothetical protein
MATIASASTWIALVADDMARRDWARHSACVERVETTDDLTDWFGDGHDVRHRRFADPPTYRPSEERGD